MTEVTNHRVTRWAPNATTGVLVAGPAGVSGSSNKRKPIYCP